MRKNRVSVDQIATASRQVDTADKVTRVRRSAKAPTVCGQNTADGHPELGRLDELPLRMRSPVENMSRSLG